VGGTNLNGQYQVTFSIDAFAPQGTWTVGALEVIDQVGNQRSYSATTLTGASFQDTFTVQ
jgi:hypothetical protein